MIHGKSLEYATRLTAIGPRVTGSSSDQRAAEWAANQFRASGLTRVAFEPFTIERGWQRVSARARITAPTERPLHVASLGWMPSTPEGGFDADLALAVGAATSGRRRTRLLTHRGGWRTKKGIKLVEK